MKYLALVWRNLLRRKLRTVMTLGAIFVSFALFGVLMVVRTAFGLGVEFAGANRLWVTNKVSIIQFMPVSYVQDVLATPGVTDAVACTWFGGSYQDKPNQFAVFATDLADYFKLYPEFKVPPDQLKAALADRQGVIVGRKTAETYGWKIGDHIPIRPDIWMAKNGGVWEFNIDGIYDGAKTVDTTQFLFRYDYFDENRRNGTGNISWIVVGVNDPSRSAELAKAIDAKFANSASESKTAPENAVIADFAKQTGDIGSMLTAILVVVFFTILLVVGSTMAQSVRERTSELAVLKTLGFPDGLILMLVLAESMFLAVLAGAAGLGLIAMLVDFGSFNSPMLPLMILTRASIITGIVLFLLLGLLAGGPPALSAMRLRITDALRRT
ncbi:MAG TPA: FtsX-like permease family protein [Vicinamibacterales bacterium]|nr:FtsX-like permease family protein [Vicinamibacterales bacterium]